MTDTLLELKGLEVTFTTRRGTLKAVDDLSLTVKRGEILGRGLEASPPDGLWRTGPRNLPPLRPRPA